MNALKWIVGAIVVVALIAIGVMLGSGLMPPRAVAQGKGTLIPWLFTWGLIWTSVLMGLIIVCYMVSNAISKTSSQ